MLPLPRILLAITLVSCVTAPWLHAQQASRPDPALRVTLEQIYQAWRNSMESGNHAQWEKTTALSRQIETKNRIVSQRLPFPQALFEDPVPSPSIEGMIPLGVLSTGETATSTYFGKPKFAVGPAAKDDVLLVLHFLREEGTWRFDNLRAVKLGNNAELLLKIRNSDFSFLTGEEFQPAKQLPPLPQPVAPPAYLAEVWIDSTGHEVTITVNGHLTGEFANARANELVIGGLRAGNNSIRIETKRIEASGSGRTPRVEVAIYAAKNPEDQAKRVYHHKPGSDFLPIVTETFSVE